MITITQADAGKWAVLGDGVTAVKIEKVDLVGDCTYVVSGERIFDESGNCVGPDHDDPYKGIARFLEKDDLDA